MLTQTYYYPTIEDKKGFRSAGLRLGEAFQKTLIGQQRIYYSAQLLTLRVFPFELGLWQNQSWSKD